MSLLPAILLLLLLLYLPGWALSRSIGVSADTLERHFERVVISALWAGWLALLLAACGIFTIWLQLGLTLIVVLLLLVIPRAQRPPPASKVRTWEWLGYAGVLLVALWLYARPFETLLGVRDAGVYASSGLAIARTGSLVQADPVLASWGQDAQSSDEMISAPARQAITNYTISQARDRYIASRLRAAGFFVSEGELSTGRILPQGLHLLPAWIALLAAIGGPHFGLFAPGLLALLGVWSVGMLGRRLVGPWVGLLAMGCLALNGVQIWFARYSTAETTAQFLIWAGLYFFARAFASPEEGDRTQQQGNYLGAALLAGVAIGQVALARIDFFLLGPLLVYLLYIWLTRRWQRSHTALLFGLGAMLIHAALHISLIARAYFFDTAHERLLRDYALIALLSLPFLSPAVRETFLTSARSALVRPLNLPGDLELGAWARLAGELGLLLLLLVALLLLRTHPAPLQRFEAWLRARRGPLLTIVMVALLLLGGYGYLVRPAMLDADLLFNTRGGWSDPLERDPALVAADVRSGRMSPEEARNQAGVILTAAPSWAVEANLEETSSQRAALRAERGPWTGPFSNQTLNWLRLQGFVGAPIRLPTQLWYAEYATMSWWERLRVDPATLTSTPAPINPKYLIPLASMVRVGWYLSPLGIILGVVGYALWWRRGLHTGSWLFLAVALVGTLFFLRQTYGTADQHYIYILRRFVPIAYPAFSLGVGYALVAMAGQGRGRAFWSRLRLALAVGCSLLLVSFYLVTNRPIIAHSEYAGALAQLETLASRFTPGRDILLMRGGAPIYAEARDVPDLIATPLRFIYGLDAFAVKSTQPGKYADDLAAAVRRMGDQGHEVYMLLSASGGSFALPGFTLQPVGEFMFDLPEFEQLVDQKPRNVARLTLPFTIYRLEPITTDLVATTPLPITPTSFAAQVVGFYRPEPRADGSSYAWSNGDAILRLPWPSGIGPQELRIELAGGRRPAHLGSAQVCLRALPEDALWPATSGVPRDLRCFTLEAEPTSYRLRLDPALLPPLPSGTLLLYLSSEAWVPATEDSRQNDRRTLGVQFSSLELLER